MCLIPECLHLLLPGMLGEPLACSTDSGINKLIVIRTLLFSASFTGTISRSKQVCFGDPYLVQKMSAP